MRKERVVIFGASRGLGAQAAEELVSQGHQVLGISRKWDLLKNLEESLGSLFKPYQMDVCEEAAWSSLEKALSEFGPQKIFYVAGGGPYGLFGERPFHSHQWAWKVTFEGAARVCHWALRQERRPQVVLVGSAICEDRPDPKASSYAAAKHALKGLYGSLKEELPDWDLRLFSPGYLDTELLPKGARVRYKNLWNPRFIAREMTAWAFDETEKGNHKSYPATPPEAPE